MSILTYIIPGRYAFALSLTRRAFSDTLRTAWDAAA
jgi:hypothetical protein